MRTIKFRIWDDELKRYIGQTPSLHLTQEQGINVSIIENYNPNLLVEQFVGITDKNGKEIYEGDKVNIELKNSVSEVFTVVYVESTARFSLLDQYCFLWGFDDTNEIEVIGNIHDNPELWEVK